MRCRPPATATPQLRAEPWKEPAPQGKAGPIMAPQASTTPDPGTAWVRASLGLVVLAVLEEGDRHGYALAQRITELGLSPVRGGALYPVLGRLETEGAVEALWQAGE